MDKSLVPQSVKSLNISGDGNFNLNLEGTFPKINKKLAFLSYPESFQPSKVNSDIDFKNLGVYGAKIERVSTKLNADKDNLKVQNFYLKAYDGKVTGDININKLFKGNLGKIDNKNAYYSGLLKVDRINMSDILSDLKDPVALKYKPYGSVNGNIKLVGKLNDPNVKAKVYSQKVSFNPKYSQFSPINNLYINADYSKSLILANTKLNSYDFGNTNLDFSMKNSDKIAFKVNTDNLKLNSLNQFLPPSANIKSGFLYGNINSDFSLKALKNQKKLTPEQITNLIRARGNLDFSQVNLLYKTAKSPFTLTNTSGSFFLDMGNGDINSKLNLNSNETGLVNANVNLNDMDQLNTKVSTVRFPLKKIEPFVPNLYVKSGNLTLNSNINTSLKALSNKNMSVDQMIAYLNTDTNLSISNTNLLYKTKNKPYSLSNGNGNFYLKSNGRDLNSNLNLLSLEYGDANAEIFVNDLNALNARININDISTKAIASFVPNLNSNVGIASVSANINASLNQIRFSKLPITSLIDTKAKINLANSNFNYSLAKGKQVKSTNTNADMYLSLKNGNIASELSYVSDQFGDGNLIASMKNFNDTYARLNINNIPSKTLEAFVPNLKVKSGNGDLKLTLNTKLNELNSDPSLDRLTYIVSANTSINFRNNSLTYKDGKSKVDIDNGLANIRFDINKGLVKSTYLFSSEQFGKLIGFLDVDKNRNVIGTLNNDRLDLRNVSQFIPNGKIERGLGKFNLAVAGNIKKFNENPSAIAIKVGFNIDELIASYNSKGKVYPIEIDTFRNTFNYTDGIVKTDLSILSKNLGSLSAYANLDSSGKLDGKIYSRDLKVSALEKFTASNNIDINSGNLGFSVNFNGMFNDLTENYLDFNADGDLSLNDLQASYTNEKLTEKINNPDGTSVVKNQLIKQNIDRMALDFKWKKGDLFIDRILFKENISEISGKGYLDIKKYLNDNKNNEQSKISIVSKNFNFKDFPITKLGNIEGGEIKNFELNTNLPTGLSDLKLSLNTAVKNLNVDNKAKIDNILAQVNIDKNIINLKDVSLYQAENYMKARGFINVSNINNPSFDVNFNSKRFPISSIFSIIPESMLTQKQVSGMIKNSSLKNLKFSYKLPVKNSYAGKNKELDINDLLNYWEQWSLEPLTEEDSKNKVKEPIWKSLSGELSANISAKGDTYEPIADINLMMSNGNIYDRKINEIFLHASYKDGDINIPNFHFIEEEGGYIKASGKMLQSGKIATDVDGKLNLNWAKTFMAESSVDIEGDTVLTVDVRGTTTNPDIAMSLDSERGGVFNNVYFDNLVFIGSYKDKIARLNDVRLISGGKEAKASGVIPLDASLGSMNVSLGLSGESLGLVNLFTREIEWLRGTGDVFLNVQGSIAEPLLNGNLNIQDAQIYVDSLGKPLEKVNVDIDLSNHFVKINKADTFLNNGKLSMLGQVDLIGFKPGFLKIKVFADDFRWEQDNINVSAKLSLNINNTISEPLIGGKIQLTKGEMVFGLGSSGSSKSSKTTKPKNKTKSSFDAQFNSLKVEIPKETDFWVRSPFFDLRPYGNLNLKEGSIYSPTVLGFAGIDKGNLYIINNEFNIIEATADFGGKDFERDIFPINPKLTISAQTKLLNPRTRQNVDVEAKITGTLEDIPDNKVKIDWTKTGGMTDSEIWTQVIGLDAAQELVQDTSSGSATTIAKFATPYFNRALFNPLTSKVANFLSLDEFNVGIASDAITNPGVAVSISKPVFLGLSVGYQGVIRTSNLAQYQFFSRYRFNNGLSIKASIDERNAAALQGEYGFGF